MMKDVLEAEGDNILVFLNCGNQLMKSVEGLVDRACYAPAVRCSMPRIGSQRLHGLPTMNRLQSPTKR